MTSHDTESHAHFLHAPAGLGGELRPISNLERRVAEASKLGFTACVVPEGSPKLSEKRFHGIEIISCSSIDEAIKVSLFS